MPRPSKGDEKATGRTETIRVDAKVEERIRGIVPAHQTVIARVCGPVLDRWLDVEFPKVTNEVARMVAQGPASVKDWKPKEREPAEPPEPPARQISVGGIDISVGVMKSPPSKTVRVPVWTKARLNILAAVRNMTANDLASSILEAWVDSAAVEVAGPVKPGGKRKG
jgi:hypothetical protein